MASPRRPGRNKTCWRADCQGVTGHSPVYHYRDRRVETHIFIWFLAYLLAKVVEQRLRAAASLSRWRTPWRP